MTQSKALITSLSVLALLAACSKQPGAVQKPNSPSVEAPRAEQSPSAAVESFATLPTKEQEQTLRKSFSPVMVELSDNMLVRAQDEESYKGYMGLIHNSSDLMKNLETYDIEFIRSLPDDLSDPARSVSETVYPWRTNRTTLTVKIRPTGDQASDDAFVKEAVGMAKRYKALEQKLGIRVTVPQNEFVQTYPITDADLKAKNAALDRTLAFFENDSMMGLMKSLKPKILLIGTSGNSSKSVQMSADASTLSIHLDYGDGSIANDLMLLVNAVSAQKR